LKGTNALIDRSIGRFLLKKHSSFRHWFSIYRNIYSINYHFFFLTSSSYIINVNTSILVYFDVIHYHSRLSFHFVNQIRNKYWMTHNDDMLLLILLHQQKSLSRVGESDTHESWQISRFFTQPFRENGLRSEFETPEKVTSPWRFSTTDLFRTMIIGWVTDFISDLTIIVVVRIVWKDILEWKST
jgi:hypothetical protein